MSARKVMFPISPFASILTVWFMTSCQTCPVRGTTNVVCIDGVLGVCTTHVEPASSTMDPHAKQSDPWDVSDESSSFGGNADDYWGALNCDQVFANGTMERPTHNASTWSFLRGVYVGVVGPQLSTIKNADLYRLNDGFDIPVDVVHIAGKGRGVIALQDIPEGTIVWDALYTARFPSTMLYRRFLASLPQDLACDIMIWAYVLNDDEEMTLDDPSTSTSSTTTAATTKLTISVDLDRGSFINTVSANEVPNLTSELPSKANRLINAGEEILMDYGDFEDTKWWNDVGFGYAGYRLWVPDSTSVKGQS